MEKWVSRSDPGKQGALAWGCLTAGAALAWFTRAAGGPGFGNERAAFWLGVLLLVIGVAGVVTHGAQSVVVDPVARLITVEDETRLGKKVRTIPFAGVVDVSVNFQGRHSSHVLFYYLVLTLVDGKTYPLFAPGRFYEGASSRAVVEEWKRRLERLLWPREGARRCGGGPGPRRRSRRRRSRVPSAPPGSSVSRTFSPSWPGSTASRPKS
jgi:hypothetical protein